MDMVNQFFLNMDQFPELKLLFTVGIILIVVIVAWLLLRNVRLWYWKTDKVLDSMRDMKMRMNQIESDLDLIKVNTALLKQSETPGLKAPEGQNELTQSGNSEKKSELNQSRSPEEQNELSQSENQNGLGKPEHQTELKESAPEIQGTKKEAEASVAAFNETVFAASEENEDAVASAAAAVPSEDNLEEAFLKEGKEALTETERLRKGSADSRTEFGLFSENREAAVKPQSQNRTKIGATQSREERIARKRALDARQTMEISREELSVLVAEWEEQQRMWKTSESEKALEKWKERENQNEHKPRELKRRQEAQSVFAKTPPRSFESNAQQEGWRTAENQNRIPMEEVRVEEPSINEELEGAKKALEELRKQKEQLEADLRAKIRV